MVERIKILSECLSTFLALTVQFVLLSVFLPLCATRKKEAAYVTAGDSARSSRIQASKVLVVKEKKLEAPAPLSNELVKLPKKLEEPKEPEKKKEPEVKPVEKKETVVKKSVKEQKIDKSKEKVDPPVEKDEEEGVFKVKTKEEPEPKTDLDSHRGDDDDDKSKDSARNKGKKKDDKKQHRPNRTEKPESSGYAY